MPLEIGDVRARRDLRTFIRLPAHLHRAHPRWVPPLYAEEWRYFRPSTNRAFAYSDVVLALARRDGKPVGRIMGIINRRYNEARRESAARFAFLECGADEDAARALLGHVERWAAAKGMSRVIGPMGFSDQDPQGFLIEGFEHEPSIGTYANFENINGFLERAGFTKDMDYVVYRVDLTHGVPDFYRRIAERAMRRGVCRLVEAKRRSDLKPYIRPVLRLMNECFRELYGYHELDDQEMEALAKRFLPILDPRFVKIAVSGGAVVGFNIAMPNLAEGFRRARGRLFPLGLFHLQRAARRAQQLDSLVGGVREDLRGKGVDAILGSATMASAAAAGLRFADSHHELEDNHKVRGEMEKLGGVVYKRFRIYGRSLSAAGHGV
jgi:GNAT superfamily N-acetyltransferase